MSKPNPFEMVHINAARDTARKRKARQDNPIHIDEFDRPIRSHDIHSVIENEVSATAYLQRGRTRLTIMEQQIVKAEREVLQRPAISKKYLNLSVVEVEKRYYYQTPSGEWKYERDVILVQNTSWIAEQIQRRVNSFGVRHMSKSDIYSVLNTASDVYESAEACGLGVPVVDIGQRARKKQAA